ncbi:hypothetical protein HDU97_010231 [Phlyctochytrium planicorne]|nr:hypothetical protein HDU97_010231 [Phlyctochytrium planicorne]
MRHRKDDGQTFYGVDDGSWKNGHNILDLEELEADCFRSGLDHLKFRVYESTPIVMPDGESAAGVSFWLEDEDDEEVDEHEVCDEGGDDVIDDAKRIIGINANPVIPSRGNKVNPQDVERLGSVFKAGSGQLRKGLTDRAMAKMASSLQRQGKTFCKGWRVGVVGNKERIRESTSTVIFSSTMNPNPASTQQRQSIPSSSDTTPSPPHVNQVTFGAFALAVCFLIVAIVVSSMYVRRLSSRKYKKQTAKAQILSREDLESSVADGDYADLATVGGYVPPVPNHPLLAQQGRAPYYNNYNPFATDGLMMGGPARPNRAYNGAGGNNNNNNNANNNNRQPTPTPSTSISQTTTQTSSLQPIPLVNRAVSQSSMNTTPSTTHSQASLLQTHSQPSSRVYYPPPSPSNRSIGSRPSFDVTRPSVDSPYSPAGPMPPLPQSSGASSVAARAAAAAANSSMQYNASQTVGPVNSEDEPSPLVRPLQLMVARNQQQQQRPQQGDQQQQQQQQQTRGRPRSISLPGNPPPIPGLEYLQAPMPMHPPPTFVEDPANVSANGGANGSAASNQMQRPGISQEKLQAYLRMQREQMEARHREALPAYEVVVDDIENGNGESGVGIQEDGELAMRIARSGEAEKKEGGENAAAAPGNVVDNVRRVNTEKTSRIMAEMAAAQTIPTAPPKSPKARGGDEDGGLGILLALGRITQDEYERLKLVMDAGRMNALKEANRGVDGVADGMISSSEKGKQVEGAVSSHMAPSRTDIVSPPRSFSTPTSNNNEPPVLQTAPTASPSNTPKQSILKRPQPTPPRPLQTSKSHSHLTSTHQPSNPTSAPPRLLPQTTHSPIPNSPTPTFQNSPITSMHGSLSRAASAGSPLPSPRGPVGMAPTASMQQQQQQRGNVPISIMARGRNGSAPGQPYPQQQSPRQPGHQPGQQQ